MSTPYDPNPAAHHDRAARPDPPSVAEIATLTARLRELTAAGRRADPAVRAAVLADKHDMIGRITAATSAAHQEAPLSGGRRDARTRMQAHEALTEIAYARATDPAGGYVLVGPSARTWRADPTTGAPVEPVSEAEHRAVRELMGRGQLTTRAPAWTTGPEGLPDVLATVVLPADMHDDDTLDDDAHEGWPPDASTAGEARGGDGPTLDGGPVLSAHTAAQVLAREGMPPEQARARVASYLDETSARAGVPAHEWGLDPADLAALRADPHPPPAGGTTPRDRADVVTDRPNSPEATYAAFSRGRGPEPADHPQVGWPRLPEDIRAGAEARRTLPARVDQPEELAARIAELRARITAQAAADAMGETDGYGGAQDRHPTAAAYRHAADADDDQHTDADEDSDGDASGWSR